MNSDYKEQLFPSCDLRKKEWFFEIQYCTQYDFHLSDMAYDESQISTVQYWFGRIHYFTSSAVQYCKHVLVSSKLFLPCTAHTICCTTMHCSRVWAFREREKLLRGGRRRRDGAGITRRDYMINVKICIWIGRKDRWVKNTRYAVQYSRVKTMRRSILGRLGRAYTQFVGIRDFGLGYFGLWNGWRRQALLSPGKICRFKRIYGNRYESHVF